MSVSFFSSKVKSPLQYKRVERTHFYLDAVSFDVEDQNMQLQKLQLGEWVWRGERRVSTQKKMLTAL